MIRSYIPIFQKVVGMPMVATLAMVATMSMVAIAGCGHPEPEPSGQMGMIRPFPDTRSGSAGSTIDGSVDADADAEPETCIIMSHNPPCHECLVEACQEPCASVSSRTDYHVYAACCSLCTDEACLEACRQGYPEAAEAVHAFDNCLHTWCSEPCNCFYTCNLTSGYPSCDSCFHLACKSICLDVIREPTFYDYLVCFSECSTTDCSEACVDEYFKAAALIDTLLECMAHHCAVDCAPVLEYFQVGE